MGCMGEGEKRRFQKSARYTTRELALLSKKQQPSEREWDEQVDGALARLDAEPEASDPELDGDGAYGVPDVHGSAPRRMPAGTNPAALISRTATVDDPLTTSLLAEVTRQSMTVEMSAQQLDEAVKIATSAELDPPALPAPPVGGPAKPADAKLTVRTARATVKTIPPPIAQTRKPDRDDG